MGKKKQVAKAAGEAQKELGNRAFQSGQFNVAIDHYTKAIEEAMSAPNCAYYANRANAWLEMG